MNDELDVMRRLVDYHDHIAAPPVLAADDLDRGRRRVRRNRGRVAGGVALGLASVAAAVSLTVGHGPTQPPQPVGPPTQPAFTPVPDNPGLTAPLVAPESLDDVQQFGFHAEGFRTFGRQLLSDRQALQVVDEGTEFGVEVYYRGHGPGLLPVDTPREEVSINGLPGTFVERFDNVGYRSYVVWEYAPDAWASVLRIDDTDPLRESQLVAIAEAIRPGGETVRVPFRIGTTSAALLDGETVVEVDVPRSTDFWYVSFESGLGISGSPATPSLCERSKDSSRSYEAFTHAGYPGCLYGTEDGRTQNAAVVLEVDGTDLMVHSSGAALTGYDVDDLKALLADITLAPSNDRSTWFDPMTAFGS